MEDDDEDDEDEDDDDDDGEDALVGALNANILFFFLLLKNFPPSCVLAA